MAQDYHIYLTSKQAESPSQKTVPWDNKTNDAKESDDSIAPFVSKGISTAQTIANQGFGAAINTGVSTLSKAVPWVAVAVAVIKIAEKTVTFMAQNYETYTGDYKYNLALDNAVNTMRNVINPLGYMKYAIERQAQFNKLNKEIEQRRMLVGDSTLRNLIKGV